MDFYGVGVRLGGKGENSIFMNCIKHKCWYMGFSQGFNERYDKIIEQVQYGDIVFAKSYLVANNQREAEMRIEAIGIVTGKDLPEDIAKDYKMGFSVSWIKLFNEPISFTANEIAIGCRKPDTIYHENDKNMKELILDMMRIDYDKEIKLCSVKTVEKK